MLVSANTKGRQGISALRYLMGEVVGIGLVVGPHTAGSGTGEVPDSKKARGGRQVAERQTAGFLAACPYLWPVLPPERHVSFNSRRPLNRCNP